MKSHDHNQENHYHHGPGHNHDGVGHLHSHVHQHSARDRDEELKVLMEGFIDGFRAAADKTSYLRIAGVPFQRPGSDGLTLRLVDAHIDSNWQIATASPAFGSRELVYMPYPGGMVRGRETMSFVYVSLTERADISLTEILMERLSDDDAFERG